MRPIRTVFNLSSQHFMWQLKPFFLGVQVVPCHSLEHLVQLYQQQPNACVLLQQNQMSLRHVQALDFARKTSQHQNTLTNRSNPRTNANTNSNATPGLEPLRGLFLADNFTDDLLAEACKWPQILLLKQSEAASAGPLIAKYLAGQHVRARSHLRHEVSSPAWLESASWAETTTLQKSCKTAQIVDFSKMGARMYLAQRAFREKEFVSLRYTNEKQQMTRVECQLKWQVEAPQGGQYLGVQFIAMAK